MTHLKSINRKAHRVTEHVRAEKEGDVVALQQPPAQPHIPLGCSLAFSPGWEADSTGGTAGLCQPVERDIFDCHLGCFWPAQVPDQVATDITRTAGDEGPHGCGRCGCWASADGR